MSEYALVKNGPQHVEIVDPTYVPPLWTADELARAEYERDMAAAPEASNYLTDEQMLEIASYDA